MIAHPKKGCDCTASLELQSILNNLFNGSIPFRVLVNNTLSDSMLYVVIYDTVSPICTSFIMIAFEIANNSKKSTFQYSDNYTLALERRQWQ